MSKEVIEALNKEGFKIDLRSDFSGKVTYISGKYSYCFDLDQITICGDVDLLLKMVESMNKAKKWITRKHKSLRDLNGYTTRSYYCDRREHNGYSIKFYSLPKEKFSDFERLGATAIKINKRSREVRLYYRIF